MNRGFDSWNTWYVFARFEAHYFFHWVITTELHFDVWCIKFYCCSHAASKPPHLTRWFFTTKQFDIYHYHWRLKINFLWNIDIVISSVVAEHNSDIKAHYIYIYIKYIVEAYFRIFHFERRYVVQSEIYENTLQQNFFTLTLVCIKQLLACNDTTRLTIFLRFHFWMAF